MESKKEQIEKAIKQALNRHLVQHVQTKDERCRVDIMADEAATEILALSQPKEVELQKPVESEWISVEDVDKPKGGVNVILNIKDANSENLVTKGYYNAGFKTWHIRSINGDEQEDVRIFPTHWMPLPQPPKNNSNN